MNDNKHSIDCVKNKFHGPYFIFPWELKRLRCQICRNKQYVVRHHYQYFPEKILRVCTVCHNLIHNRDIENWKYKKWRPNAGSSWRFYGSGKGSLKKNKERRNYVSWRQHYLDNY